MVKLRARCILVGDAAVGKSALSQTFRSDGVHFPKNYSMTARVELLVKSVNIPDTSDSVELVIFDSGGKETFMEACEKLWGQPSVLCLVFDVTSVASFSSCGHWLDMLRNHFQGLQVAGEDHYQGLQVPGVLVGNKLDLSSRREVETAMAQEWAQNQGLEYHETSAKEMDNCDGPFLSLAKEFYNMYQDRLQTIRTLA